MKNVLKLKDIAELAGVSLTTASMCLNGKAERYKIAKATRERIERVMRERGFQPNIHARAMAGKKTYLIGVVLSGAANKSFWFDILDGVQRVIEPRGYHMILSVSRQRREKELAALEFMLSKSIDGLIIGPTLDEGDNNHDYLRELRQNKPMVTVTTKLEGINSVYNDEKIGGAAAARFLMDKGHRRVAFIGPVNRFQNRCGYFREAAEEIGMDVVRYDSAAAMVKRANEHTAVFCFSDYVALAVYEEASGVGLSIPEDLSVIGYDDMDFSARLNPRLTTVRQHKVPLGEAAAAALLNILDGGEKARDRVFKPKLVKGGSVAAVSASNSNRR